jgi:hypothetical protein
MRHHSKTVAAKKTGTGVQTRTDPLVVISAVVTLNRGKAGIGGDPACIKDYNGGKRRVKEFAGKESRSVGSG